MSASDSLKAFPLVPPYVFAQLPMQVSSLVEHPPTQAMRLTQSGSPSHASPEAQQLLATQFEQSEGTDVPIAA